MLKIKVSKSVLLYLTITCISLFGTGQSESVKTAEKNAMPTAGTYVLPFYSEEWQLNLTPGQSGSGEAAISNNAEAAMSSFAFLAVELSKSHKDVRLTGIIQARSIINEGFDIILICRYNKNGQPQYLKSVIRHDLYGNLSLEKLILDLDFKP